MIVLLVLGVAYASGVDWRRLAVVGVAVYLPWLAAAMVGWITWKARSDYGNRPVLFCEGVSAELRAGSTLRHALLAAASSVGMRSHSVRDLRSLPLSEIAVALREEFPAIAEELRLTVLNAASSGSQVADLFEEIGSLAIAQNEIRREVHVAAAPGRATATLMVGAPLLYLIGRAESRGLGRMLETSHQRIVVVIGLGLFLTGAAVALIVVWRASR